jgi:hypothetical protein
MPPSTAAENAFRPEQETHLVVRDAVIAADHYAGDRTERRADDESDGDDAVDVDAHQARDCLVLGGCAHRDAQLGPVHEQQQTDHHRGRAQDDRDLHVGDRCAVRVVGQMIRDRLHDLRIGQRVAAPDDHREVLEDDRQPDRGDQRREARRTPERPIGDALECVADRHADRDRGERRRDDDGQRRSPVLAPTSATMTV